MTQVVKMDRWETHRAKRWQPDTAVEAAVPQRPAFRAREQQPVIARRRMGHDVRREVGHDQLRDSNRAFPGPRLWRAKGKSAATRLTQLPGNAHRTALRVDVTPAQRRQLSPAQARAGRARAGCPTTPG